MLGKLFWPVTLRMYLKTLDIPLEWRDNNNLDSNSYLAEEMRWCNYCSKRLILDDLEGEG